MDERPGARPELTPEEERQRDELIESMRRHLAETVAQARRANFKDAVIHKTEIRLGWWQRLRYLFTGRLAYGVRIETENEVGLLEVSEQTARVLPRRDRPGPTMTKDECSP